MAREGTLEDPAVPPDVEPPPKHLLCSQKAPDVVREGPDPDAGDTKTPRVAQNTSEAPDVAAETPNPDVLWTKNGHRTLLVDSNTDVEEEGPNPDVGSPNQLKMTQNVPETPYVGLKPPNPGVPWLKNGCGMLVVESDTDVEDEKADPDVESPKRRKVTPNVPETPDVAAESRNPDVPGPKVWRGMELVDSDTDVEEDPDAQPPKRLKMAQNVPGIPDVKVETPNPAVEVTRSGHWTLLVESDTDEEGEEEDPKVQPQKCLRMTQNVPETPHVAAKAPNPDVSGPKLRHWMPLGDSDTDVEDEVSPDLQSPKRSQVTQSVPGIPDVEVGTLNPAVERPKIRHRRLVVDSDTDVEEDPDVEPTKRLQGTQKVPEMPDVRLGTPNPDVSTSRIRCQVLLVDSDTDVEEDPDVEPLKQFRVTQNVPESPDVAAETPSPDVSGPEIRCQTFLVDSDTDVEEEEVNPDVEALRKLKMTPNVPESPDVGLKSPNPDVAKPENGRGALLGDSKADVEGDEASPDVWPAKRKKMTQNVPETPDVPSQTPNPAVGGSWRGHRALLEDSETDVEEEVEADPDVRPTKRRKMTQNVQPTPPNADLGRLQGTPNSARVPGLEAEEERWDPDVATQLFLPPGPDVRKAGADPAVGSPKRLKTTQRPPKIPDVEETPDPDVEEESDPYVATQPFLPSPDVGSPETVPKAPKVPDVEGLPSLDPDVATQLFLPPDPDVMHHPNPDVLGPKQLKTALDEPRIPDVRLKSPNPDVAKPENGRGALLGDSKADVEDDEASPDVWPAKRKKMTQNVPETPDVPSQTPNPAVGGSWRGHRALLEDSETDVEEEADPDVRLTKRQKMTQNVQPTPPNADLGRLQGTPNSAQVPGLEAEEERWDPDVATQLFLPPGPDVRKAGADPAVGSPKLLKTTQRPPKIPDVEETPDPDVEEESDPDVATQPFLPSPDVGSPETVPKAPKVPDVEGLPSLDPDVATQLFLPPDPDVMHHPNPDVLGRKQLKTALDEPRIPDVRTATPDPDGVREEDFDVATQLFLSPNPDVEGPLVPDVGSPQTPKTPLNRPSFPAVEADTPKPDVEGPCPDPDVATQLFLTPNPDVEGEGPSDPGVWSPQTPPNPPEIPYLAAKPPKPDVEGPCPDPDVATQLFLTPNPDVEGEGPSDPGVWSPQTPPNPPEIPYLGAKPPKPDVEGPGVPCPDPDVATQLFLPPDPAVERKAPSDSDVGLSKPPQTPPTLPEIPDVEAETPNADVEGAGRPRPDPDVATQLFLSLNPDGEHPESREPSLKESQIPDVKREPPNPAVGGAPGAGQEEAEALPTPQVRRSQRLAESRGGVASSDSTPKGCDQDHKPRPQRRRDRAQATPSRSAKGSGRGSVSAPPPQQERPAEGARRRLRPRPAPGAAHIRVLFTGLVASPALLVALGRLGGTEATSVRDCSHLVTDHIRRTLKFFCALGRGIPIVTPQWLLQSSYSGRLLSPDPFLPQDPSLERRFGFRLSPALARARARPLLQGYQVHVTPSVQPCPKDMRDIVTCCGGTFLPQLPREHAPRVLVISCPQDRPLWAPAVAARLPLLSAELLLSGVLRQRLDIAQFLLTPLEPPHPPLKSPNPPKKTPNPAKNPTRKTPNPPKNPPNPPQKTPNPTQNPMNPPPKHQNPSRTPQSRAQNTPAPPQSPPPSPPRTRSGQRRPQPPLKTPQNSGTSQKKPNPLQKSLKRPRGHSEDANCNFRVLDPPQEPPMTRSRRGPPQNPPRVPPNSETPKKPPKGPPKKSSPPQTPPHLSPITPKQPPEGPNLNFGVLNPSLDPPQEAPRTRSRQRATPNSGTPHKTPNPPPKPSKPPPNGPNSTQKQPRGPLEGPHPKSEDPEPPPSPPRTRSRRGLPQNPPKSSKSQ